MREKVFMCMFWSCCYVDKTFHCVRQCGQCHVASLVLLAPTQLVQMAFGKEQSIPAAKYFQCKSAILRVFESASPQKTLGSLRAELVLLSHSRMTGQQ